jgi:hypothetical protein
LVHHSIAILYHEVPNPNITIRNFFIAVSCARGHRFKISKSHTAAQLPLSPTQPSLSCLDHTEPLGTNDSCLWQPPCGGCTCTRGSASSMCTTTAVVKYSELASSYPSRVRLAKKARQQLAARMRISSLESSSLFCRLGYTSRRCSELSPGPATCTHAPIVSPASAGGASYEGELPLHDCSPHSHVHLRRESLGVVHRSRTIFCRPVPNPPIRNFCIAGYLQDHLHEVGASAACVRVVVLVHARHHRGQQLHNTTPRVS